MNEINIKKIILSNKLIALISIIFSLVIILIVNIYQSKKNYTFEHILTFKVHIDDFNEPVVLYK